jgi:hypothetical protein
MAFQRSLYPDHWSHMRSEALARTKNEDGVPTCELCHVPEGTRRRNTRTNRPYYVTLSICHRFFYQTWKADADTIVLCQRCHNKFDAKFRKRFKLTRETPVGITKVYIYDESNRPVLVEMCRTYIELIAVIDSFAIGQEFEIQLEINLCAVGNGWYIRTKTGTETIQEYGAAVHLHTAFTVIPQRLKPKYEEEYAQTAI